MKGGKITILIAEDHKIVLMGLKALLDLEEDLKVVGQAETGTDAVFLCKKLNPNVVVMDIALPQLNGLDAAKLIRRTHPNTKILILSAS